MPLMCDKNLSNSLHLLTRVVKMEKLDLLTLFMKSGGANHTPCCDGVIQLDMKQRSPIYMRSYACRIFSDLTYKDGNKDFTHKDALLFFLSL